MLEGDRMKIDLKTIVHADIDVFWSKLKDPTSLYFVALPIISFDGIDDVTHGEHWKEGETYQLPMRYFGRIPAGSQSVRMMTVNDGARLIVTDESGGVARKWIHTMELTQLGNGQVRYRDTLEIQAGMKTPFLWLFVQLFYRHRQRRWHELLQMS